MARSIDPHDPQPKAVRGFIPARTDEERYLMRHIEDLARTAFSREIARYSGFLSDREQDLARAALGRADIEEGFRFEGGWPQAERRILCLEPEYSYGENPIRCVRLQCRALPGAALPAHKDYLGSLMGLELKREALGDIVLLQLLLDLVQKTIHVLCTVAAEVFFKLYRADILRSQHSHFLPLLLILKKFDD